MFGSNVVGAKFGRKSAPKQPWDCTTCGRSNAAHWAVCPECSSDRPKE